jgi:hypothetical protein
MKIKVSGAHPTDAVSQEIVDATIVTEPQLLRGQHGIKAAYLQAEGDGGTKSTAVVLFNANTGEFAIRNTTPKDKPTFDFDLPVAEFKAKRASAKRRKPPGNKKQTGTPAKQQQPSNQQQ